MKVFGFNITREAKASAAGFTMVRNPGQPQWSGRDYAAFAREAYSWNVVAFRSISMISEAVGRVDWDLWSGGDIVENPRLRALWDRPNQEQSGPEFLKAVTGYLLIAGNSYIEAVTGGGNEPVELWAKRPDLMKVIPGADGMPVAYEYKENGRRFVFENGEIRHLKTFNPLNHFYGLSPVEPAMYGVDQHTEAQKWTQALLQNSAMPSGR